MLVFIEKNTITNDLHAIKLCHNLVDNFSLKFEILYDLDGQVLLHFVN